MWSCAQETYIPFYRIWKEGLMLKSLLHALTKEMIELSQVIPWGLPDELF